MDLFRHVDLESFHMQPKNHISISAESLFLKLSRYHKAKSHRKISSAFNIHAFHNLKASLKIQAMESDSLVQIQSHPSMGFGTNHILFLNFNVQMGLVRG